MKKLLITFFALILTTSIFCGCSKQTSSEGPVIIYSNADDEAVLAIKKALENDNDLKRKRVQSISVFNNKKKDDRIATIADKINSGTIIFNEYNNEYNQQVFDFCGQNYSLHDDAIDSLEMAVNNIEKIENKKITLLDKSLLF